MLIFEMFGHISCICFIGLQVRLILVLVSVGALLSTWLTPRDVTRVVNYVAAGFHSVEKINDTDNDADLLCIFTTFKPSINKTTVSRVT